MDTRISGDMLEAALIAGICSVGAEVVSLGIIPTPGVSYLTRYYKADAGVVISASHSPFEFNGIKFFNGNGYKLSDAIEERIEAIILDNSEVLPVPKGENVGKKTINEDAVDEYVEFLKKTIDCDLKGLKIAIDCANGAAYEAAPIVLFDMGADVLVINNEPDGININKDF